MMKIILTAMLVLFSTSSVAQAQMTPLPGPNPSGYSLSCIIIAKEIEDLKGKIGFEEFRLIDAKQLRDQKARDLAQYRKDLADGKASGASRDYIASCEALILRGETQLKEAEENLANVQESVEFWLRIYNALLFLAEVKYAGFNCPIIP
jgi:hypothetical protein